MESGEDWALREVVTCPWTDGCNEREKERERERETKVHLFIILR